MATVIIEPLPAERNRYWLKEIEDAKELIEHSRGMSYSFVFLDRARAIVAVDEELKRLRHASDVVTAAVGP